MHAPHKIVQERDFVYSQYYKSKQDFLYIKKTNSTKSEVFGLEV